MIQSSTQKYADIKARIIVIVSQNAYVDTVFDTRNLVEVLIYILVVDVQDTPPIFSLAPAVTTISNTLATVRYLFINTIAAIIEWIKAFQFRSSENYY